MNRTEKTDRFERFLQEYLEYLDGVVEEQNQKLAVLLTHDLEAIGRNVTRQQAITLEIKGHEERRAKLQQEAGFGEMTLGEIVEALDGEERQRFRHYHEGLRRAVEQIKFLNEKAMQLVETDLQIINMVMPESQGYTEDGRQISGAPGGGSSILDSKI